MPAILTAQKLIAKLTWGLDDNAIGSTAQHEEAARQLDYLKGSTSHWSPADTRLTQPVNGVSVLQARDRIRASPAWIGELRQLIGTSSPSEE